MSPNLNMKTILVITFGCIAGPSLAEPRAMDIIPDKCDINDVHFIWDSELKECLPLANNTLLSKCISHLQCLKSSLGPLSRCSPETGLCECYDWDSQGRAGTTCFAEKCFLKKNLEDFCTLDQECQAGVHMDAVCVKHPNFLPHEKVCFCPEERSCKNLGDACTTDRECQDGINEEAICALKQGEFICVCPEGSVCMKELRDPTNNRDILKIVLVVGSVLGAIVLVILVVIVVMRCKKKSYFV